MLVVKTGMQSEFNLVKQFAANGVMLLTGVQTTADLEKLVPQEAKAIISVGLCGGISPDAQVGQIFIADTLVTPNGNFEADVAWRKRLFQATKAFERHWWSSGQFNTANTPEQRADLFKSSGCWVIDDETYAVAQFAKNRKIPFQAIRSVSDGTDSNLPPAVISALNTDGSINIWNVIASLCSNPFQIPALVQTALEARKSLSTLKTTLGQIGPNFSWVES
jgi:adenosylhomocysteine nucleosidase